ncbi:hypothetical protein [Streptomyces sp. TBY4]|uniref:hypothetical protein n=1 Tax=Streptomyces sp. TBY4 TaxID=2962030 RepID=UPI0020B7E315|nr:hypothetical protein [Streptomyces sp. TBY4]MCP3758181.1 hypothetical protein [Streptomyces sp. TBY4]
MSDLPVIAFFVVLATGVVVWLVALVLAVVGLARGAVRLWQATVARAVAARVG